MIFARSMVWHHSRVHRFFSAARWDTDVLGTVVIRLIVGWLVPMGEPLVIAVDDTMFRRWGRKVHGAYWGYDGSVKAPPNTAKISRGNSFVVAAVVVQLPLLDRPVALPVLMRLWHKGGPSKTVLARRLIHALANAAPGRRLHVVADSAYACNQMRDLPQQATVTAPMPSRASLWHVHPDVDNPPRLRGPGRPPGRRRPHRYPGAAGHRNARRGHVRHPVRPHGHHHRARAAVPVARRVRRPTGPRRRG